jgi:hypothetical protein
MGIFNKLLGAIGKVAPAIPGVGALRAFDDSERKRLLDQKLLQPQPDRGFTPPPETPYRLPVEPPPVPKNPGVPEIPALSQDVGQQRTFEQLPTNPISPADIQKMAPSPLTPPKPIGERVKPITTTTPSEAFMKILRRFSGQGEEITAPPVPLGTAVSPRPPVLEFDPNAAPYRFSLNPEDETANQPVGFRENVAPVGPAVAPPTTGATTTEGQPRFGQVPAGPFGVSPMEVKREPLLPKPTTPQGQQGPLTTTPADLDRLRQEATKRQFGLGGEDIRQPGALYERFQQERAAAQAAQNRVKVPFQGQDAYIENGIVYDGNGNRLASLSDAIKDSKFYRDLQLSSLNPQLEKAVAEGRWDDVNRLKTAIARAEYEYAQNPTPDKKRGIRDFIKAAGLGALKGFLTGGPAGAIGGAFGGGVASIINPNADEQLMGELFTIPRAKRRYEQAAATELAASEARKKAAEGEKAEIETEIKRAELVGTPYKTLQEKLKAKAEWLKKFKGGNGPYSADEIAEMDKQSMGLFGEPTYMEPGRYYGTGATRTFDRKTGQVIMTTPSGDAVPVYVFNSDGTRTPQYDLTQVETIIYDDQKRPIGAMTSEEYMKFLQQDDKERRRTILAMQREERKQAEVLIQGHKTTIRTARAKRTTALGRQGQLRTELDGILLQIKGDPQKGVKSIEQLKREAMTDPSTGKVVDLADLDSPQKKALAEIEAKERQLRVDEQRVRGEIQNQQNIIDGADAEIEGATGSVEEIVAGLRAGQQEGAGTNAAPTSGLERQQAGGAAHGELSEPDAKGFRYGLGTSTHPDGKSYYDGEVLVDSENTVWAHGKGTRYYDDDATATGTFQNGQLNGAGVYTFADGSKYEGNFKDGDFNGQGKRTYPNGLVYEGTFKADQKEGKGTLTYPDGTKFEGTFKGDVPKNGTITFADGRKYVGKVNAQGNADGEGEFFDADGKSTGKGKFKDGKPVTTSTVAVAPK